MIAKGTFEINMQPQSGDHIPAGRFTLDKLYHGEMQGKGLGQMISKRIEGGAAIYYALEEFVGTLEGKRGSFTLAHKGFMNAEGQILEIEIMEGSGSDELAGISGKLSIQQVDGVHHYELNYQLN